jgi:hypothetical protein
MNDNKQHEDYDWKKQFLEDVKSVRVEVRRRGGIKEEAIEDAIQRYRYEAEEIAEDAERA